MKKLITAAVASAFAFLAIGAGNANGLPSGTSLEDLTSGEALNPAKDDYGAGSDSTYWFLQGDENAELLVTNYESGVTLPSRPAQFAEETNNNFLKIDTTGRLYRSIGVNSQTVDSFPTTDISDGLYLDTLVQFTAADDQFKDDALAGGDKIAISYVERDAESVDQGETPYTNFVIRAGYIVGDNETIATNYFATVPAGFNKDDWHRLTVRAVASIAASGTQKAGFIVYLDGVALEYSTDVECGVDFAPANAVAEYYKADCHAIYPSAVQAGTDRFTLSAVAFNGNGCVDDISFTDQTPSFIGRTVTFDLGTGDAVTKLTVAGVDYDVAGVATTNIENLVESFTIAVTLAENYNIDVITNFEGCTYASTTETSGIVTLTAASATVKVITTRNNFDYIDGSGDSQTAVTLADALANVGDGETIVLKFDYVLADWGEAGSTYDIVGKAVTIDLHGKKIEGGIGEEETELFYVEAGAELTVIDSVGGGEVNYVTDYGIFYVEGDVFIGKETGDAGATFNGRLFAEDTVGIVVRGYFDAGSNSNGDDFLWKTALDPDAQSEAALNQAGTYWVVTPTGGSSDTPVAVPMPLLGITYDGTEKTGVVAQVGYTLSGNTAVNAGTYEAIAMLQSGYVWSDDNTKTNKTISWSIAADHTAVVDVTLASEIEEWTDQLDFPAATATIGGVSVEGTTNWVEGVISEPSAGVTNIYTVTFTVTTANYAGSTGTATFKVYKAAGGSYPSYIPEDAAVKAKYDTWATTYGADTGSVYEDAFLLNIAPDAVDQTLEPTSITISGGKIVIDANKDLYAVNGKVYIKTSATLSGLATALWSEATVNASGEIEMTPNGTAAFFKIKVDFTAGNP